MAKPLSIAIIGAGPAGLIAAEMLAREGMQITLYERMPSPARKFLMAGRGGLNLTHSEDMQKFMPRYGAAEKYLARAIENFSPAMLRGWCEELGQPTFIGSSGRIFPKAFKASPLLRAWLQRLDRLGVTFAFRHAWRGWNVAGALRFETLAGNISVTPAATLLALGGASWPRLGADGGWVDILKAENISVAPLHPANCGFITNWSEIFRTRFQGAPLKGAAYSFNGITRRGEAMITKTGMEGGAIYALSAALRDAIAEKGCAEMHIDLRPDMPTSELVQKLSQRGSQSTSTFLKRLGFSAEAIGLLHESGPLVFDDLSKLAAYMKRLPVIFTATAPIDRAISSAGGIAFTALTENFMLRGKPGVFAAGEMLDWEAPTGGYLLQASFSTGVAAARGMLEWLNKA